MHLLVRDIQLHPVRDTEPRRGGSLDPTLQLFQASKEPVIPLLVQALSKCLRKEGEWQEGEGSISEHLLDARGVY